MSLDYDIKRQLNDTVDMCDKRLSDIEDDKKELEEEKVDVKDIKKKIEDILMEY